jgi:SSS family solute:Na+ symporter
MIVGMSLAIFGVVVKQLPEHLLEGESPLLILASFVRTEITGQVLTFWSIAVSVSLYVIVSLMTCKEPFDLDRMLHRGTWARDDDVDKHTAPSSWLQRLGFDSNMTRWDRFVTAITLAWPVFFTIVFVVGLVYYVWPGSTPITDQQWADGWRIWLWVAIGTATAVTAWFALGGLRDVVRMFRKLAYVRSDIADDGSVVGGMNRDDLESTRKGDSD